MSLAIDLDNVTHVLLADGWHTVGKRSFALDSYEYVWQGDLIHGGGRSDICATGFSFIDDEDAHIAGPLTSVLAVRTTRR